jgi:hypothetical protein
VNIDDSIDSSREKTRYLERELIPTRGCVRQPRRIQGAPIHIILRCSSCASLKKRHDRRIGALINGVAAGRTTSTRRLSGRGRRHVQRRLPKLIASVRVGRRREQ